MVFRASVKIPGNKRDTDDYKFSTYWEAEKVIKKVWPKAHRKQRKHETIVDYYSGSHWVGQVTQSGN